LKFISSGIYNVFARLIFDRKMTPTLYTHPGIYDGISRLVVNLQEAISIRVNTRI
jgi:hypothetical protein